MLQLVLVVDIRGLEVKLGVRIRLSIRVRFMVSVDLQLGLTHFRVMVRRLGLGFSFV